jgi:AhpD family alkylhydroperoxidase
MPRTPTASSAQDIPSAAREAYGFLPNLIQELNDHNPAAAKLYLATTDLIEEGTLSDRERETVLLTVSRYNDCHYCSSAHAKMAVTEGLPEDAVEAISNGGLPSDDRLRVLVQATRLMLDKRGWLDDEDLESLRGKGVGRTELIEINALIGIKTFSNYVNHVAGTEIDEEFQG